MKATYLLIVFLIIGNLLYSSELTGNINTQLLEKMSTSSEDEFIRVNISLTDIYDSQKMILETSRMAKQNKREYVTSKLKEFSALSQADLISQLNGLESASKVRNIKTLWIVNVVNCEMTKNAIDKISERNDIALIDYDEERNILLAPTINKEPSEYLHEIRDGREITWNVTKVNADDVWAQGYYGLGVIVAVLDTGVNYNHTDLNDHLWSHPDYPNHGYDFVNSDNNPMDDHGHGTHCAGTVAGDGTSGSQTGMAPEASIMCVKLLDDGGGGYESVCWEAVEFAVDNGADVLSMSFGWQHSWGTNRTAWRDVMDYAYAAD
ncbi:MAG: S8 family serine peptidase, partial [Candidatus Delongbacteria bacterium]|nr:S8 family serine peptidase [Candidatus Delongbacteria bacterium]